MSANSSSRGEDALRLFSVRGSSSSPGAMEQNPRYFHSSWEQHTHAIKHGMKRIIRGAQRWIHARKHLPCLIGSVTFSGLSRLLHLPDMMGREGSEEEGQRYKQTEIKKKSTTDYFKQELPLCVFQARKSKCHKFSCKNWFSNKHEHRQTHVALTTLLLWENNFFIPVVSSLPYSLINVKGAICKNGPPVDNKQIGGSMLNLLE